MRTALVLFLVLCAAAASTAYYTDDVVQEAIRSAQDAIAAGEFQLEAPKVSRAEMMLVDEANGGCFNCTKASAKWVMDHVIAHIKKKCAETESPKFKRMCEKAGEHPAVTFGYLLAAVRPMSLGYAWCNGKGECGKKAAEDEMVDFDDELSVSSALDSILKKADEEEEEEGAVVLAGPQEEDYMLADEDVPADDAEGRFACRHCIRGVSKGFMFRTIGKIKKYCHMTKCPFLKKMCMAAKRHPKVAFGYLFYKLRPMEFAFGFCMGKGKCGHHGSCNYQDEIVFDMMDDDRLSLEDGSQDAAIFY